MGVASGCGEQEVGVASGSGWQQHPYFFFHFVKMILRSCSSTFFKLHFRY